MQIKIDVKILIFALIFYITKQLDLYFILMTFALFHEISHLIVGLMLGFKPYIFEIKPVGYSIAFNNPVADYNIKIKNGNLLELKKIFVYIAGPIFNLFFALFFCFYEYKDELIYSNFVLFFINLIPIYPLDGGRILKSFICLLFGVKKSYVIVKNISSIFFIFFLVVCSMVIIKVNNYGLLLGILYLIVIKYRESKFINKKINMYETIDKMEQAGKWNMKQSEKY